MQSKTIRVAIILSVVALQALVGCAAQPLIRRSDSFTADKTAEPRKTIVAGYTATSPDAKGLGEYSATPLTAALEKRGIQLFFDKDRAEKMAPTLNVKTALKTHFIHPDSTSWTPAVLGGPLSGPTTKAVIEKGHADDANELYAFVHVASKEVGFIVRWLNVSVDVLIFDQQGNKVAQFIGAADGPSGFFSVDHGWQALEKTFNDALTSLESAEVSKF